MTAQKTVVVALGGNAIYKQGEQGSIHQQFANTRSSMEGVADILEQGHRVIVTHGNGPQVGNYLIRVEHAGDIVPLVPLGVIVADLQGGIGYMIEQCLQNVLLKRSFSISVACVLTQVMVDKNDPSMSDPTKFVGPFYSEERAKEIMSERDWNIKKDSNRGWRRVVPSPNPLSIIEKELVESLLDQGRVVIAAGGGGIPVYREENGWLEGVDGVIDKDLSSAVLGNDVGAEDLLIMTGVEKVAINFGQPNQRELETITVSEAQRYFDEGHFPAGSMGPKIRAAIRFLQGGGKRVVITSIENSAAAVRGEAGTVLVND
ncbi:MAG: carbamate kinase [Calditrichia bacterium]